MRSGTNPEENLPDLGTYVELCYHGGSLPESHLFVVTKDTGGAGGPGEKTENQLRREREKAQKNNLGELVKNSEMNKEHRFTGKTTTELTKRTGEKSSIRRKASSRLMLGYMATTSPVKRLMREKSNPAILSMSVLSSKELER